MYAKRKEHVRYVCNLSSLLNYKQGTEEVKRAGRAFVSFQVKYFFFSWLAGNHPHFLTTIGSDDQRLMVVLFCLQSFIPRPEMHYLILFLFGCY
uniref:Uncharacterized protein n=1 Tax=Rhizophagus irregularis (strain DAOM 181602 / DAOM 197198 / MUCL 43194) TaxID=747089 RepID=U9SK49_RHIID